MFKINGEEITAQWFAYDGCHKIYLIENMDDMEDAEAEGYSVSPIRYLLECFVYACPLRFIQIWGGDFRTIVRQAEPVIVFEGFKLSADAETLEYDITRDGGKITLDYYDK